MQNDGCLNFVDENDEVLISGFGRRGKAKGDIPGVRFKVVKVSGVGLLALWKEKKVCPLFPPYSSNGSLSHRKSPGHRLCLGPVASPYIPPHAYKNLIRMLPRPMPSTSTCNSDKRIREGECP